MKKSKIAGIVGTVAVHLIVLLLLFWLTLSRPAPQEEGGVPVMLGNAEVAAGDADPYTLTEVDVMPQPETAPAEPERVEPAPEQPMITQNDEPSIQIKKEQPKNRNSQRNRNSLKKRR